MVARLTEDSSVRGCGSELGSVTSRGLGTQKSLGIWLVKLSGGRRSATEWLQGQQQISAQLVGGYPWRIGHWHRLGFQLATMALADSEKLLPGFRQIYEVNAMAFPFAEVPFHSYLQGGATQVGSCSKEFEDTLLTHLQSIKVSFSVMWEPRTMSDGSLSR